MSSIHDPRTPDDRRPEGGQGSVASSPPTFNPGDLLCDRFHVIRFIARGGMGELYEADDLELKERVALKTIRPDIAGIDRINQRFRREVQLARRVTHPNICRIFDFFLHQPSGSGSSAAGPVGFVTMELLEGETLAQRLKRTGAMALELTRPIVAQMVAALAAAHAVGVVHRDLKTNNVMLLDADHGGVPRVVVTDFGLAYSVGDGSVAASGSISAIGEVIGTPDYMSPEQVEGSPVTPASDIYTLGIVMYEMVTGERPFTAETPVATALRRVSGPPARPPRELVPNLPPAWNRTIMRCLARYPDNRFSDVNAVIRSLDGEASASSSSARRLGFVAAIAGVVAVVALLAWRGYRPAAPEETAGRAPGAAAPAAATATHADRRAVAVLGFRNLAGRTEAQWLSTALSEMLTTELGAGEELRTIPGETINRMKMELALADADAYASDTLTRIRQNLDTDLVVFGSYVTVGSGRDETLRVDIRLQDSRQGQTVSLVSETGKTTELLDVVSRAGRRLRDRLGVEAPEAAMESVHAAQSASPEAMRLYSEGLMRLRRFDALGARESLERAIRTDPLFPLAHTALANTWSALGYDNRARDAAARAVELSSDLPRAERLLVEGTYREMASDWPEAISIWQTLSTFFPDDVEYALRLANAQISAGQPQDGLGTIEKFRKDFPERRDPRLDLAEATAAETLADFKRMQKAAVAASTAAQAQGARLLVAAAKLREGGAVLRLGDSEAAARLFDEARRIYADAGDRAGVSRALNNLAGAISDGPETERANALYEEGLTIARAIGEQDLVARFLNNMAIQRRRAGDLQGSLRLNRESLAIRREIGDRTNTATSLNNIGNVLLDLGDIKGAAAHYEQSAAMNREIGDRRGVARALHNAAEALHQQGELTRARATTEEALAIRRGIDDPASVATSLFGLGQISGTQGDLVVAKKALNEALVIDRRLNRRRPIAYSLYILGEIAVVEGDLAGARRLHQEALDIRTKLGEKGTAAESRVALAGLALEEGMPSEAESLARDAAAVFQAQGAPDNEATARAALALAMLAQRRSTPALQEVQRARTLVRNTQNVLVRTPVAIAAARVDAASNASRAVQSLESIAAEAAKRGIPRYEFEARRAIVEIQGRGSPAAAAKLTALQKDAKTRGFGLYARP